MCPLESLPSSRRRTSFRAVAFAVIGAEETSFRVAFMCERLGVSRAGYFAWCARQATPSAPCTVAAVKLIATLATLRTVQAASPVTDGVPQVIPELRLGLGRPGNRKRVARLMVSSDGQGLIRRKSWRRAKPATRSRSLTISSTAYSVPPDRVSCGSPTSTSTRPETAGSIARTSWRTAAAGSNATLFFTATTGRGVSPGCSDRVCARPDGSHR